MRLAFAVSLLLLAMPAFSQTDRWVLSKDGGIETTRARLTGGKPHADHLEMGGRSVNAIVRWSVDETGRVTLERLVRWPMLREKKDDTHAALSESLFSRDDPSVLIDDKPYGGAAAESFRIHGMLSWKEAGSLEIERTVFPSVESPVLLERWEFVNQTTKPVTVRVPQPTREDLLPKERFAWAAHRLRREWIGPRHFTLMPGQRMVGGYAFSAREDGQPAPFPNIEAEWAARQAFVRSLEENLTLETGDPVVDRLFAFSKLRAAENVLATRGGLMHAPGGFNRYLAALWCNDQNEYVSPFFPFLGDPGGNESARNAYAWFAKYMNPEFKPIPSSIVAEGRGIWAGAGDRGDAAMTAYGASRWALATGDPELAREVWPFIQWCLEYCERQKTAEGVIASDRDELEGRFSTGKTNLATSCLTYDALISAAYLAEALGSAPSEAALYRKRATELRTAIERVFGAKVEGFETYRYHEGLSKLRAWICIPLAMDILDRAEGTVGALLSPQLWTRDGLLTEAGTTTYWDRSTLYALRGIFRAARPDIAADYLHRYSERRLLGDHVPYCQEAFPEGSQSHLSAESGLFCRIVTEGAFGIRPTGFQSFSARPQLPKSWKSMTLRNVRAFGRSWDAVVTRKPAGVELLVRCGAKECYRRTLPAGSDHEVRLP